MTDETMKITTGKPANHQAVRQVIVCPPDVMTPGKGWYRYCEIRAGELAIDHGGGHTTRARLHLAGGVRLDTASVWRAGGGPEVPEGAHAVHREDYPLPVTQVDVEEFIEAHKDDELSREIVQALRRRLDNPMDDAPSADELAEVRRWRGDIDHVLLDQSRSPRTLTHDQEIQAFLAARLSSDYLCCSVLHEHGRWTYRTGWGGYTRVHGACDTLEAAKLMALAHVHRAWLGAVERVTELAGGRTDWLGGVAAPHEPQVYRMSPTQARDKAWAEYHDRLGDEVYRRGATAQEMSAISARAERLAQDGE